ncbi:MAG: hypothetical protein ABI318_19105 [Chthoniobacteraceae bacterium]
MTLPRGGEQLVAWFRELEECRIGGLVPDEDYCYQRAEKFDSLLRPTRGIWLAALLGAALIGAPAGALIWWLTRDWRFTGGIGALSAAWGSMSLGRALSEKFADLQLRGRRKILVALLENDLLTASEFADYDDRLATGCQDVA